MSRLVLCTRAVVSTAQRPVCKFDLGERRDKCLRNFHVSEVNGHGVARQPRRRVNREIALAGLTLQRSSNRRQCRS